MAAEAPAPTKLSDRRSRKSGRLIRALFNTPHFFAPLLPTAKNLKPLRASLLIYALEVESISAEANQLNHDVTLRLALCIKENN